MRHLEKRLLAKRYWRETNHTIQRSKTLPAQKTSGFLATIISASIVGILVTCTAAYGSLNHNEQRHVVSAEVRDSGLPTEHCAVSFTFTLPHGQTVFKANHFYPKTYHRQLMHTGGGGFWPGLLDTADSSIISEGTAQATFGGDVLNDRTWIGYNHFYELG